MPGSQEEIVASVEVLRAGGALPYTTIVAATEGSSLGERYAAACYACSIGEYARDSGRPALVILDDISSLVSPQPCNPADLFQAGERLHLGCASVLTELAQRLKWICSCCLSQHIAHKGHHVDVA